MIQNHHLRWTGYGRPSQTPTPQELFLEHESLRLYADAQFASPYAMSAFVALHEKGLPFEIATIDLAASENHAPNFVAASLTRRVPTMVHNGFSLSESSAIAEYLDEIFPGRPLYPLEPRRRRGGPPPQAW